MVLSEEWKARVSKPSCPLWQNQKDFSPLQMDFLVYILHIGLMGTQQPLETTITLRPQWYDTTRES